MELSRCLAGEAFTQTLKVGATVTAKTLVMRDTNKYGHVIPVTTTGSAKSYGLALTGATYSTSIEGSVEVITNPFAIYKAKCSGSATAGTALSATTYHVLTQTSASTTVLTATNAGTDYSGGTMIGLTGANAGLRRIITSVTSTTAYTVTVAFPNSIAVGDKMLVIPYSVGSLKVQPTTGLVEADASIATGTGIDCAVMDVQIDLPINDVNPVVWVEFFLHDNIFNPID